MISLIHFTKARVMPLTDATLLGVESSPTKVAYSLSGELENLGISDKLAGVDVFEDSEGVWRKPPKEGEEEGEKIQNYYVYRPVAKDFPKYVKLEEQYMVDLEVFLPLCTYEFSILKTVTPKSSGIEGMVDTLKTVEDKILRLGKMADTMQNFNMKCDVHVGGGLIATFNDLMLKEDTCTDELMEEVQNGWRIIAVCVQPNQRRPDYILGRYNPTLDTGQDAKR